MLGLRLTRESVVLATIIGTFAALVYATTGDFFALTPAWRGAFAAIVLLVLLTTVTFRQATLREWVVRWRRSHTPLKSGVMVDAAGRAMVWSDEYASMFIEIGGDQWAMSKIGSTGEATVKLMPIADLRRELRQFDITTAHIRVIEMGYKVAAADKASKDTLTMMGTVGYSLGGRVLVEVAVALSDNLNALKDRQKERDTVADGITRVLGVATERVKRKLLTHNISARTLSPTALAAIHRDLFGNLEGAISAPKWSYAGIPGDASAGAVVAFSPSPSSWNRHAQLEWNEVLAHRQYNCLELRPSSVEKDKDVVDYATSYLTDEPGLLQLLPSQGLVRENGRHLARVSNILPLAKDSSRSHSGRTLAVSDDVGLSVPVHPLGVYLGTTDNRERVFMSIARGDSPMWVCGDDEYARRLVFRLSSQRHRIVVSVEGAGWDHLINSRRSKRLTRTDSPGNALHSCDVLVCTPEQEMDLTLTSDSPAVVVVSAESPRTAKLASIVRDGDHLVVTSGRSTERVMHENVPTERPWMELPSARKARRPEPLRERTPPPPRRPRPVPSPNNDSRTPLTPSPPRQEPSSPHERPMSGTRKSHSADGERRVPPRSGVPDPRAVPPMPTRAARHAASPSPENPRRSRHRAED